MTSENSTNPRTTREAVDEMNASDPVPRSKDPIVAIWGETCPECGFDEGHDMGCEAEVVFPW
jgi:hypothetical protein